MRSYGFLGAILPYANPEWEELAIFLNLLIPKLPAPKEPSVVSCDNITTIPTDAVGEQIGVLLDSQEPALSDAIVAAFDLD